MKIELHKLVDYLQPTKYIVTSDEYSDEFETPVLTAGKTFILGYTNEIKGIYVADKEKEVILFDDFTTSFQWVDFSFKVKSSACKILIPKKDVDLRFIFYAMQKVSIDKGLHKRYWISVFSKQKIYYPDALVRGKIVKVLDTIKSLIDLYSEQIKTFEEIIRAKFCDIFGEPSSLNTNKANKKINQIGKCIAGATPNTSIKEYWENGTIPWLTSGEVSSGRIFKTEKKITQKGYENTSTKLVPARSVVIALAGQGKTRGTVGITEIELCTNQSVCSVIPHNHNEISIDYLYYYLKYQYSQLRAISNGEGGRGGLNLTILGDFSVYVPEYKEQIEFVKLAIEFESLIKKSQEQIEFLNELFVKKLDDFFDGKNNA